MIRSVLICTPLSVTTSMFFLVSFSFSSDWSSTLCPKMYRGSSKCGQNQKFPGKNLPVCSHRAEPRLLSQAEPLWLDSGWLAADPGLLAAFWSGPEPPGQRLILSHLQMLQNSRIQPWPAYEVRGHEGDTRPDMTATIVTPHLLLWIFSPDFSSHFHSSWPASNHQNWVCSLDLNTHTLLGMMWLSTGLGSVVVPARWSPRTTARRSGETPPCWTSLEMPHQSQYTGWGGCTGSPATQTTP